jgi:mRNA interferase RelE/StbE
MYSVVIMKKAKKEIGSLSIKDRFRVLAALDVLREDPFVGKKLEGKHEGAWSLRVWPFRIMYTIYRETVTVVVLRVRHRKDVYR